MNFCERCGYEYAAGARFCAACGSRISSLEPEGTGRHEPAEASQPDLQVPVWPTMDVSEVAAGGLESEPDAASVSLVPAPDEEAGATSATALPEIEPASLAEGVAAPETDDRTETGTELRPDWVFSGDEDLAIPQAPATGDTDLEENWAEPEEGGAAVEAPTIEYGIEEAGEAEESEEVEMPTEPPLPPPLPVDDRSRMWTTVGIGAFALAIVLLVVLVVTGGEEPQERAAVQPPSPAPSSVAQPSAPPTDPTKQTAAIIAPLEPVQRSVTANLIRIGTGTAGFTELRSTARALDNAVTTAQASARSLPAGNVRMRTLLLSALSVHSRYAGTLASLPAVNGFTQEQAGRIRVQAEAVEKAYRALARVLPKAAQMPVDAAHTGELEAIVAEPPAPVSPAPDVPAGDTTTGEPGEPTVRISD